jgi:hypothetical protein
MSNQAKSPARVLTSGLAVTIWVSAISFGTILLLATATWVFSADLESSLSDVVSFAATAFLVINGIEVQFSSLALNLRFSGFIVLVFYILFRTFRWAIKSALQDNSANPTQKSIGILSVGVISYTALIFSIYYQQNKTFDNWLLVIAWPFALSLVAGVMAILAVGGTWSLIKSGLDETSKNIINTTKRAFIFIFVISFFVFVLLGYKSWLEVLGVFYDLGADGFAIAIMIILGLGWLPNYFIWIWSVLSDVSLNLGSSVVSLSGVNVTQLPAWPWFALIPEEIPSWGEYLIAFPIFIGVLIAIFSHNEKYPNWLVGIFFSSLSVSGILLILSWFTNGSLGLELLNNFGADSITLFKNNFIFFTIGSIVVVFLKILWQRATAPEEAETVEKDE